MANRKGVLLLLSLLLPTWAFAHGEEILYTVYLQLGSGFIFLLAIVLLHLSYAGKAFLVTVYLLTTFLTWGVITHLPFLHYMSWINLLVGGVPLLSALAAYGILRLPRKT